MRLIVTGSAGLVGKPLLAALRARGHEVLAIDLREPGGHALDFRDDRCLRLIEGVDGIVHLAAVSRVAWGEADPELCQAINVAGTRALLERVSERSLAPWFLFASSREVYGNPERALVQETDPLLPVNHYGRSKLEGERAVERARAAGAVTATVRLCNVYGGREDHPDRAVPALVQRALAGDRLVLTGSGCYFDFVHVADVVSGLLLSIDRLAAGQADLPTIHLATGRKTTLRELAELAVAASASGSVIEEVAARAFDVSGFCGSPDFAREVLGWRAEIAINDGIAEIVADVLAHGPLAPFVLAELARGYSEPR